MTRDLRVSLVAAVLTILLVATGLVLLATRPSPAVAGGAANLAVVDAPATAKVIGQVDTALTRILSYKYSSPGATQAAASQVLVGDAASQYRELFAQLKKTSAGQQLTLTANVVAAGVTSLTPTTAQLLVFLDQSSTRSSDGTQGTSAAQIRVGAVQRDGVWKISELQAF